MGTSEKNSEEIGGGTLVNIYMFDIYQSFPNLFFIFQSFPIKFFSTKEIIFIYKVGKPAVYLMTNATSTPAVTARKKNLNQISILVNSGLYVVMVKTTSLTPKCLSSDSSPEKDSLKAYRG